MEEIQRILQHMRAEIPEGPYFELGDDPEILGRIRRHLSKLTRTLEGLKDFYLAKPSLSERNPYFEAIGVAGEIQDFLAEVPENKASSRKTSHLKKLMDELGRSIARLARGDLPETVAAGPDKGTEEAAHPPLSEPADPVPARRYEESVFISYAWGDEREELVDKIEQALQARGLRIIRDKRDLEYKGSIQGFMERIGQGDCVIVVVSDKYLRSPNCMFELVEIAKNKEFRNRIFPVIWKDANIYRPVKQVEYIRYWEGQKSELAEAIRSVEPSHLKGIWEQMDLYDQIRDQISELTTILKDMNALTPEKHEESNFSQLYDAIEKRLKQTSR